MKERPILMSGEMVRATMREIDPKTNTRRVIKLPDFIPNGTERWTFITDSTNRKQKGNFCLAQINEAGKSFTERGRELTIFSGKCPYGKIGDRLWVRETFYPNEYMQCRYRADGKQFCFINGEKTDHEFIVTKWRPSIFMPRWASRILLEITNIRIERLQDISGMDAKHEGVSIPAHMPQDGADLDYARREFQKLWDKINGKKHPWANNEYVWVIEFRRI